MVTNQQTYGYIISKRAQQSDVDRKFRLKKNGWQGEYVLKETEDR